MARNLQCLPNEIVFHILSCLPIKSLAKFKCVCKLWNTLFLDPQFRSLYWRNFARVLVFEDIPAAFLQKSLVFLTKAVSSEGLLLQQTNSSVSFASRRCRILWLLSEQYLEFSCPRNTSLCFAIEFIPSCRAVKLLSVHEDRNHQGLGFEFLHVGDPSIENISPTSTYCWRPLDVPPRRLSGKRKTSLSMYSLQKDTLYRSAKRHGVVPFMCKSGAAYCIWQNDNSLDLQVDVLDMVKESYVGHATLPEALFFPDQLHEIQLLDWNGQLAIAQVEKDELHVFVLSEKQKNWNWTRRMFNLTSLKHTAVKLICFVAAKSALFFSLSRPFKNSDLCSIDIITGNITTIGTSYPYPLTEVTVNFFL